MAGSGPENVIPWSSFLASDVFSTTSGVTGCDCGASPSGDAAGEASLTVSCERDGERAKATARPTPATSTTARIRFLSHV